MDRKNSKLFQAPIRVIFDSPDKTGKTTITKELSRILCIPYFKNNAERTAFLKSDSDYFVNTLKYAEPFFLDYIGQTNSSFILDRSYVSEWVYSRLFGRPSDDDAIHWVDGRYAALGASIVIPYRSSYVGRQDEDSLGLIDEVKMERTESLYREFSEWSSCDCHFLNVDDEDLEREIEETIKFLERDNGKK